MASIKFSHIALNCADMAAIEGYYTKHFGFSRSRVIPLGEQQIVFIKSGDVYLELFSAEGGSPTAGEGDGPHQVGVRHLAFQVDDVDVKLASMGEDAHVTLGLLSFDDFIPGWRTVWVADPEGNIVEISQGYQDQEDPPEP